MFTIELAILALALSIATYTDLRWTEVPDWLSYSTIAIALGIASFNSITTQSTTPLGLSLFGLGVCAAIGLSLFYLGQWGGGDAKLLMGVGAMLGFTLNLFHPLARYLAGLLILGGIYSLLWTSVVALKHRSTVAQHLRIAYQRKGIIRAQLALILLGVALSILALSLPLTLEEHIMSVASALGIPALLVIYVCLRTIEQQCFRKRVSTRELIEGDWVAEPITHKRKTIYTPQATGLTLDDITRIQKSGATHATIKSGIPFIPAFLLALIPLFFL